MNINREALVELIKCRAAEFVDDLIQGLEATANHGRASTANLVVKISHDEDDANKINVRLQQKLKRPRSRNQDLTSWTDEDELCCFNVDEAPGQQRLAGT